MCGREVFARDNPVGMEARELGELFFRLFTVTRPRLRFGRGGILRAPAGVGLGVAVQSNLLAPIP